MGEGEYELTKVSKKGRHRKKLLYNSILQLMEFYFSDSNLAKDRFLSQLINEDPFVDLNIFLKFNKIRKLNCTLEDIRKAIGKSDLIELSEDKERIKRKLPIKIKENVDLCTVYVENIPADANHEWISHIFSDFGNVVYVSIPKYKHNKTNKGFAFVEFEDEQSAKNALDYFESIGYKMPSETSPESLKSIQTFQEKGNENQSIEDSEIMNVEVTESKNTEEQAVTTESNNTKENTISTELKNTEEQAITTESKKSSKRYLEDCSESTSKKLKLENETDTKNTNIENVETDDTDNKKKKKHKKDKKKTIIKELGLQVLLKPEWKKMRNRYLDLQKKQMKEFKQYLQKRKHFDRTKRSGAENSQNSHDSVKAEEITKLEFVEGVIVKVKLPEPIIDAKKVKTEVKTISRDIKYVDIPLPSGSEEIFLRFSNNQNAKEFCTKEFPGEKTILEGNEEQMYWEKIKNDRSVKFSKNDKKQRGRDKLLKKAEKLMAKHIKFDEGE